MSYVLFLIYMVVKTNVDYQIIASFATQDETSQTLVEALSMIKLWNQNWNPICFMVDNCEEEITAIKTLLPCK